MSDRTLRLAAGVLGLAGTGIAAYLTYGHYSGARLACSTGGCETVTRSRYSELAGVPVAVLGLGAFLAVLTTALAEGETARIAGAAIAVGGLAFAAYLLTVQIFVIHAICQWCAASDTLLAPLAAVTVTRLVSLDPPSGVIAGGPTGRLGRVPVPQPRPDAWARRGNAKRTGRVQAAPGGRSPAGKRPRRPRRAIRPARIGGSRLRPAGDVSRSP